MADLFESALGLEENHLQEGFDAGVK